MIALDFDGVVANYGDHINETRFNPALPGILPPGAPVVIVTNQGGMALSRRRPEKYPVPAQVGHRLLAGCEFLAQHGHRVEGVYVSAYHPEAFAAAIQAAAKKLRNSLRRLDGVAWRVYTTPESRKPSPFMLRRAGATCYYGDSPEDAQAAEAAGITFVFVQRFL